MMRISRVLVAMVPVAAAVTAVSSPVLAAPPANDTQAGAVVISGVPFSYSEDTTEATVDAAESVARDFCLGVGAPAFEHAVWFTATVTGTSTDALLIDVSQADYGAGIAVLQDTGSGLSALDCVPRSFVAAGGAPAGTYYFVVFGDGTTPTTGGNLTFTVQVLPPPPDVQVSINKVGTATKEGGVWVSGTVSCTSVDPSALALFVDGQISQTVGRLIITSFFTAAPFVPCDGASYAWQAYAPPTNGKFAGGKAASVSIATACDSAQCSEGYTEAVVKLNRARL